MGGAKGIPTKAVAGEFLSSFFFFIRLLLSSMKIHHFLIVSFPAQGHFNPSLQLANRLINLGHHVTLATSLYATNLLINKAHHELTAPHRSPGQVFSFATFRDGCSDEVFKRLGDLNYYFSELGIYGPESLTELIVSAKNDNRPFTFLIYTFLFNWAADVASAFDIPSALFFVQPAAVLSLYYHYINGYEDAICAKLNENENENENERSLYIELPGLPLLTAQDIPSFLSPSSLHACVIPFLRQQMKFLDQQTHSSILVNTFDALEREALKSIDKFKMIPIGPLISPAFHGGKLDSRKENIDYIKWLNSKPNSSVIYVSFGTMCELSDQQEDEISHALKDSGHAFLWVKRLKNETEKVESESGKIVPWCYQVEVLNHPSVGCFLTHCGWNSSIESLVSGMPVVGFPQQVDQTTNAKLIEDVWKTGVRVKTADNGNGGIVRRTEIKRCLDLVFRDGEMRKNAKRWKKLAKEAMDEGGLSDLNLKSFISEISM